MISAKTVAIVGALGLVGVAQDTVDGHRTLRNAFVLLDELPRQDLQRSTAMQIERLRMAESHRRQLEAARRKSLSRKEQLDTLRDLKNVRHVLKSAWPVFFRNLAEDYNRIREKDESVSLAMLQLLLLSQIPCADPALEQFVVIGSLTNAGFTELADDLLLAAETPEEGLLAHLYRLHEEDQETRIRTALILAQMGTLATDIVPHLVEELWDPNMFVRRESITALGMLGTAAKDAIPNLERLTQYDDPQISARAKAALRQVRGR